MPRVIPAVPVRSPARPWVMSGCVGSAACQGGCDGGSTEEDAEGEHPEREDGERAEHQRHVAVFVAGDRACVVPPVG